MNIAPLLDERMQLGESIVWDPAEQSLLWVDVGRRSWLYHFDTLRGNLRKTQYDGFVSGIALSDQEDTFILLTDTGLKLYQPSLDAITHYLDVEADQPQNRCNDWGVDPQGRLWFGTMQNNLCDSNVPFGKRGSLYCLAEGILHRKASQLGIPNTLVWSSDATKFYLADSFESTIYSYDFHDGAILNPQVFSKIEAAGVPDGSTLDAADRLWNCRWGDAAVFVFNPDKTLATQIPVPALQVTSCTFGGPDMTTLYITTACHEMTPQQQAEYPLAGSVFKLETSTRGTTRGRVKLA